MGDHSSIAVEEEARSMGVEGVQIVDVNGNESVMEVLRLCDPRRVLTTEADFISFWSEVRGAVAKFLYIHHTHALISKTRKRKD